MVISKFMTFSTRLDIEKFKNYAANAGFCKLWATGNVKNLGKYLKYPKIFSYPMKMWQKIFIPYGNVTKYFDTPLDSLRPGSRH